MKEQTAYKAARKSGKLYCYDLYYSVFVPLDDLRLEYRIGRKTVPKVGKILLFETKENAIEFVNAQHGSLNSLQFVILEGSAEGLTKPPPWLIGGIYPDDREDAWEIVERFWGGELFVEGIFGRTLPRGTMAAKSFTPWREVDL